MGAYTALFGEESQPDSQTNIVAPKKSAFAGRNPQIQPTQEEDDLDAIMRGSVERNQQRQAGQRTWTGAFSEGFKNLGSNFGKIAQGAYQAVTHPVETASELGSAALGAFKYTMPFMPSSDEQVKKFANMVDDYTKKYGTTEGLKESIATNPIGTVLDLAPMGAPALKGASKYIPKIYIEPKPALDLANTTKFQSGGSAATQLASEIATELHDASPEMKQAFANGGAGAINETNLKVLKNHNQFAKFDMIPTEGQALEDHALMSQEYNDRAKDPRIMQSYEHRDQNLINGINKIRDEISGETQFNNNPSELANDVLTSLKNRYEQQAQIVKNKWDIANNAAGQSMSPIDIGALQLNIENGLKQAGRTRYLPENLKADLTDAFEKGYLTPQEFENFRTDTATIMRSNPDPMARQAAGIVRDKLENVPIKDEFAIYKPLFDDARAATVQLKQLESKPFMQAAISDTRTPEQISQGTIHPASQNFVEKYYGPKTPESDINQLIDFIGKESPEHQALNRATIENIKQKIGIVDDKGVPKQQALQNLLYKTNGYGNRIAQMMGNKIANDINDFADVARKTESVKGRGYVNTSNTALVSEQKAVTQAAKELGISAAEQLVNAKTGVGGTLAKQFLKSRAERKSQEAAAAEAEAISKRRVSPTAGFKLSDIGKEQK